MTRFGKLLWIPASALLACSAWIGAEREAPRPERGGAGRIVYLTYCESCHGLEGRGDGPAAAWLYRLPPDLTRLSERYGTPLDRQRLARYIDGRRLITAHEPREMPIWGLEFFDESPPGEPTAERARQRIFELLIDYLETIQSRQGA